MPGQLDLLALHHPQIEALLSQSLQQQQQPPPAASLAGPPSTSSPRRASQQGNASSSLSRTPSTALPDSAPGDSPKRISSRRELLKQLSFVRDGEGKGGAAAPLLALRPEQLKCLQVRSTRSMHPTPAQIAKRTNDEDSACARPCPLLARLQSGARLGRLLVRLVGYALSHAGLLVQAAHLAAGGDLSKSATLMPLEPEVRTPLRLALALCPLMPSPPPPAPAAERATPRKASLGATSRAHHAQAPGGLSGEALLDHMGAVSRAKAAPLLPGALMSTALQALHSKLSYLVQPTGFAAGA